MRTLDSRRITGPHLLLDAPGAAIEIALDPDEPPEESELLWRNRIARAVWRLGWNVEPSGIVIRRWDPPKVGFSGAFNAPIDLLEVACFVAEQAVVDDVDTDALQTAISDASRPRICARMAEAAQRGWPAFWDDEGITVGYGKYSYTQDINRLPGEWPNDYQPGRIPIVLVTGTNGKTTTSRLLARIAREAGFSDGLTSSDAIAVRGKAVITGDWSGPGAARTLLRRTDVDFAVLETARGGLLRRGLAVTDADIAIVTNVSADHFGEYGIDTLDGMAAAKFSIIKGLRPGAILVYNAGNPPSIPYVEQVRETRPDLRLVPFHDDGSETLTLGNRLVLWKDVPITLGGLARHNIENVAAACAAATALGLPIDAIERAILSFAPNSQDSAGRTNWIEFRGAKVMVDFAHNTEGIRCMGALLSGIPASRRLLSFGHAGDRSNAMCAETAEVAASFRCDLYIIKDLPNYLRGRAPGEVPALLRAGLLAHGVPDDRIRLADHDLHAAQMVREWLRPKDFAVLLVHEQTTAVLQMFSGG